MLNYWRNSERIPVELTGQTNQRSAMCVDCRRVLKPGTGVQWATRWSAAHSTVSYRCPTCSEEYARVEDAGAAARPILAEICDLLGADTHLGEYAMGHIESLVNQAGLDAPALADEILRALRAVETKRFTDYWPVVGRCVESYKTAAVTR